MTYQIKLTPEHGDLILSISFISIECIIFGMLVLPVRKRVFNKEFMKKNFYEQHKKTTN